MTAVPGQGRLFEEKETMTCPDCGADMGEPVDTTYSNTGRAPDYVDLRHTGDIYHCEKCDKKWLDDFIHGKVVVWYG